MITQIMEKYSLKGEGANLKEKKSLTYPIREVRIRNEITDELPIREVKPC